jgi:hypothetical protein
METALYSKLRTVFSSSGTTRTQTLPTTKESSGASTNHIVNVKHDYVELTDVQLPIHPQQLEPKMNQEV